MINFLIQSFSAFIVFIDLLIPIYIVLYVIALKTKKPFLVGFFKFISDNFLSFGFLISLSATLGSFFLSTIANYPPCELCWYQRIFMFPQPVILGVAMFKNDISIKTYSIILAAIGLLIAFYHILVQNGQVYSPCSTQAVNCSVKQFVYFGYVTIPVMSATAFIALIILSLPAIKKKKR